MDNNVDCGNLTGTHIGDALKINKTLHRISFHGISLGTRGANRLIEVIKENKFIRSYDFGNLTETSLKYLIKYMSNKHIIKNLYIGEDMKEPW